MLACVEAQTRYRGDAPFKSFLFGIARRQLLQYLRSKERAINESYRSVGSSAGFVGGLRSDRANARDEKRNIRRGATLGFDRQVRAGHVVRTVGVPPNLDEALSEIRPADVLEVSRLSARAQQALLGRGQPVRVGRYVVEGVLGAGSSGMVYEAFDPELRRDVALKMLRDTDAQPLELARLRREASALGRLADPELLAVFDASHRTSTRGSRRRSPRFATPRSFSLATCTARTAFSTELQRSSRASTSAPARRDARAASFALRSKPRR